MSVESDTTCLPIRDDLDIVTARQCGRALAERLGFSRTDATLVATAISEVARNIVVYATRGEVQLRALLQDGRIGILVVAVDHGPGIADLQLAMQDGYSTTRSLGLGLPGARRLMDEFDIASTLGQGTTVTMRKWMRRPR